MEEGCQKGGGKGVVKSGEWEIFQKEKNWFIKKCQKISLIKKTQKTSLFLPNI